MSEAMLLARNKKKAGPKKPQIYGMELSMDEKLKQGKTLILLIIFDF